MYDSKLFSKGNYAFLNSVYCFATENVKSHSIRAHSVQWNSVDCSYIVYVCLCLCVQAFVQPSNSKQRQQLHFQEKRLAQSVSHSPNSIAIINTLATECKENPTHFD